MDGGEVKSLTKKANWYITPDGNRQGDLQKREFMERKKNPIMIPNKWIVINRSHFSPN